jgi:hypothetical protein
MIQGKVYKINVGEKVPSCVPAWKPLSDDRKEKAFLATIFYKSIYQLSLYQR